METLLTALSAYSTDSICILDPAISLDDYVPIDLSKDNKELSSLNITNYQVCQQYIDLVLSRKQATIAFGGYLEERNLYNDKKGFTSKSNSMRNIHLGVDFWCTAGTKVIAPLHGTVHSFKNNFALGDYGPTIILKHVLKKVPFYTLYGHLSLDSLAGLFLGKIFNAGETLGRLGTPDINVNYAPHLHFQIIEDLEGNEGDYPGVCAKSRLHFYQENCPDPNILLKL